MDDFITPKPTLTALVRGMFNLMSTKDTTGDEGYLALSMYTTPMVYTLDEDSETTKGKAVLECEDPESWMLKNFSSQDHPLELMVCVKLLICHKTVGRD